MFKKVKGFIKSTKGKIACAVASAGATLGSTMTALAAEGTETTFLEGIKQFWAEVTKQVNIGNLISIILIVIGSAIGLALFWFGIRYVIRKIMAALKKGKVTA